MRTKRRIRHLRYQRSSNQQGYALVVALIFLLLITMLAMSASGDSLLQERMAGSLRNAQQAQMSAETALRGAENKIWSMAAQPDAHLHCIEGSISRDDGCVIYNPHAGPYRANGAVRAFQSTQSWLSNIGVIYAGPTRRGYTSNTAQPTAALAKNPVYIIEDLGSERSAGTNGLHESGNTGPNNGGAGQVNVHIYRITARATGGNPNGISIVQSTFDAPVSY